MGTPHKQRFILSILSIHVFLLNMDGQDGQDFVGVQMGDGLVSHESLP